MQASLSHTISLKLMPSNLLMGLILILSILACGAILYLPIAFLIKLLAIAMILASSTYYILRDALLRLPWSWQRLEVDSKGRLKLFNLRGEMFMPQLHASSFVHNMLVILNFKRERFKMALPPVILLATSEHANELRRLKIWLRWFGQDDLSAHDELL